MIEVNKQVCLYVADLAKNARIKELLKTEITIPIDYCESIICRPKEATISASLQGLVIEYAIKIYFSLSNQQIQNEIINEVEKELVFLKKTLDNIKLQSTYSRKFDDKTFLLYGISVEDFAKDMNDEVNFYEKLQFIYKHQMLQYDELKITKVRYYKECFNVRKYKYYYFIYAEDYYKTFIQGFTNFLLEYKSLCSNKNYFKQIENEKFVFSILIVTQILSNKRAMGPVNRSSQGRFNLLDIKFIKEIFLSLPLDYLQSVQEVQIQKQLVFTVPRIRTVNRSIIGRVDFLVNNEFLEIKVTSSISKSHFYQLILYYIISLYDVDIKRNSAVKFGNILYPLKGKIVRINFEELVSKEAIDKITNEIMLVIRKVK
jgi:hypothetical protein